MQLSGLGKSRKGKSWMEQCKQLILDLSTALNNKEAQNQDLQAKITALHLQIAEITSHQQQLQAKINTFQKQDQENLRVQQQLRQENHSLKINAQFQSREIEKMRAINQELSLAVEAKERQIAQLSNKIKTSKNQLVEAHSHINFLKIEIEKLRQKMHSQERQYQEELENLRDINNTIKHQFDHINADYIEAFSTFQADTNKSDLSFKKRPKIHKIGMARSTEFYSNNKTSDSSNKPSNNNTQNPQIGQELLKIKHQIANQYNRFSESRQKMMKERVTRTLTNIDSLLGKMECRIQEDSSSN